MIILILVPIVHLLIVWWLFRGINKSSNPHISNPFSALLEKVQTENIKKISKWVYIGVTALVLFIIMLFNPLECGMCGNKISSEVGRSYQYEDWHGKIKRDGKAATYNFCDRSCEARFATEYMVGMKKYIEP